VLVFLCGNYYAEIFPLCRPCLSQRLGTGLDLKILTRVMMTPPIS
jgi:hypothetical protein